MTFKISRKKCKIELNNVTFNYIIGKELYEMNVNTKLSQNGGF